MAALFGVLAWCFFLIVDVLKEVERDNKEIKFSVKVCVCVCACVVWESCSKVRLSSMSTSHINSMSLPKFSKGFVRISFCGSLVWARLPVKKV